MNWGMKVLQTFALPLGHGTEYGKRNAAAFLISFGAGDEARTRYLHLGKVALYRMSYTRIMRAPNSGYAKSPKGNERFQRKLNNLIGASGRS